MNLTKSSSLYIFYLLYIFKIDIYEYKLNTLSLPLSLSTLCIGENNVL